MHLNLPTKRYYSTGEVAKAFNVNASLIRFWDKQFEALKPKKNAKGNRRFTPEDVQNLKLIFNLVKERGYTLEGAKTYLKEQNQKSLNDFDIITKLERVRNELIKIKNQLQVNNFKRFVTYFRGLFFTHIYCNRYAFKVVQRSQFVF